jgi:hypothetical protein
VVTPQATIRNNGNNSQTFNVRFDISPGYTNTQSVTLAGSASTTVSFAAWNANTIGTFTTKCTTLLTGDRAPANDFKTGSVLVQRLDAECVTIIAPTGTVNQGAVITPQANIRNNGNTSQTFTVRFDIQGGYTSTQSVTLAGGASTTVNFAAWTASALGTFTTKCTTMLSGDMDPANDAKIGSVFVQRLDAEVVAIVQPAGTVNQGAVLAPQAVVRNNGNSTQTFDVRFDISDGYNNTQSVTLAAGASTTITFTNWTASALGTFVTKCSTRLAGDMDRSNDKQTGSVFVQYLDAECIAIVGPSGTVNQCAVITPQATIRNNGNSTQTFNVRFDIGVGYSSTKSLSVNNP